MGPPLGSALPFLLWKQERKSDKSDGWAVVHLRKRLGGQIKLFTDHFNVSLSRYTDQWSAQAIEKVIHSPTRHFVNCDGRILDRYENRRKRSFNPPFALRSMLLQRMQRKRQDRDGKSCKTLLFSRGAPNRITTAVRPTLPFKV